MMQTANREKLRQFETRLLAVERSASLDLPFAEFFEQFQRAFQTVEDVSGYNIWLFAHGTPEQVLSTDGSSRVPTNPETTRAELAEERITTELESSNPDSPVWCCRCYEEVSRAYVVCLEIRLLTDPSDNFLFGNAMVALCECLGTWFRRSLIARMEQRFSAQNSATEFCHKVYPILNERNFDSRAASEIRLLLKVDRACMVSVNDGVVSVIGVSGTDKTDKLLEIPQALKNLSAELFPSDSVRDSGWENLKQVDGLLEQLPVETRTVLLDGGTSHVRGFRIQPSQSPEANGTELRVVAELFNNNDFPTELHWKSGVDQITRVLSLSNITRDSTSGFRTRLRKVGSLLFGITLLSALSLIPVDFEIEASGHYVPKTEHRIFAPGAGIIEELTVRHEAEVNAGQLLLRIHSPDLTLKLQEVFGQLETEKVRLSSLQRTRLSADNTAQSRDGVEHALGGEQAVRQRIVDLESRLKLLKSQQESLSIQADAAGKVYRRNLEIDLPARPIQTGDFLFDLIPDNSEWQLELEVPDSVMKYLPPVSHPEQVPTPIRFRFAAAPEATLSATVSHVNSSIAHENGKSHGIVIASMDTSALQLNKKHLQPGATVSARILCGRRACGFVLFREFVEFVQEKWFVWF